jgi:signal transduction histidine kinase/CHASE3 domain sensor protein
LDRDRDAETTSDGTDRLGLTFLGATQRRLLALVPAVLVLLVGALAYQRAKSVISDVREVEHSHAIIESADALLTRAVDAETGQRAYLITGDQTFLEPYRGARGDIDRWLDSLRVLVRGDPAQSQLLGDVAALVSERFALLDTGIAEKRRGSPTTRSAERLQAGKRKMDQLRTIVAAVHTHEHEKLEHRHAAEQRGVRDAALVVGTAVVFAVVLSTMVSLFFSYALKERERANSELAELNRDLEHQSEQLEVQATEMESQSAELEATAEDLKLANEALSREQQGATLLSDASRILASTLDYETTLNAVAKLAVGKVADWCAVDLVEASGAIRQVVVAHEDEAKVRWAKELNKRYPPDYDRPTGVGSVIRTGNPQIYSDITDEMLVASARDADHLAIMRELGIKSAIIVPMVARGRTLGALTLISSDPGRRYSEADQSLLMELATRAAVAIDNAQLYRAALAASDARAAFLATMSHELRTPLNAIIGYQSLLSEGISGKMNDSQLAQLSRIRASADHLLNLIDEVLTFSRLDAGKEIILREEVDLRSVVASAISMVAPLAAGKGLKVRDETSDGRLITDGGKVRQILLNLLSNAVKFSDDGDIIVRSHRDDGSLAISVVDPGIGIARENLENVFDPFWQVEQRSTRRVGGTGLGLSVSRRLARLLGGEVTVESSLNKGSTFTLVLPVSPASP